jgi:Cdc6-like AAA superfamily ATPase
MTQIFSWQGALVEIDKRGVRKTFTPHKPISEIQSLFGRQNELMRILGCLDTPGRHVLLYGDRGVGKSSLAKVVPLLVDAKKRLPYHYMACDSQTTFATLSRAILQRLGAQGLDESSFAHEEMMKANVSAVIATGELNSKKTTTTKIPSRTFTPAAVASMLEGHKAAIIAIDEADTITSDEDKGRIAELLKLLSDADFNIKVIVVGIADTARELMGGHPSVQRCLDEVKLGRMEQEDIRQLILRGMARLKFDCEPAVATEVAKLANGFPYFAHIIGLNLAAMAVHEGRKHIRLAHVAKALDHSAESAEQTLKDAYKSATRSSTTTVYVRAVNAAAQIEATEFSIKDVKDKYSELYREAMRDSTCSNVFRRLAGENSGHIFKRLGRGIYRFADPRMPSFARMRYRAQTQGSAQPKGAA